MEGRFDDEHNDDSSLTPPPENAADSPISGDEEAYAPFPKKRRGANKRVVVVPIGDGSRSKTEVYPPPDSWSWRKYGQKPIKGSPYPRGYYRCSSSKGCAARKQVERSRLDPTTLLITYSSNHTHPLPTTTKHHGPPPPAVAASSVAKPTLTSSDECNRQLDIEPCPADDRFVELAGEFGWMCDVGPIVVDGAALVGPAWGSNADVEFVGDEDKLLFGDLGDLPEYSMVFRRHRPCYAGTG
ncbi:probable WRKY transcription factor 69 isoform X2 [Salvia splendens]|uniref:probable WRKY transcription factor 69 isoform X2 n=1 Tax=Salvia splendens TaxID=180675 RepID=UPI001C2812F7|nr:probable WRKY transcription factor 69 isoform X2 [Salvia splendens]